MMISRRPVSSPGRVEPLMGFLRSKSNGGSTSRNRSRSRSKGRSRASPLFVRRNKSAAAVTQEPSSPKVTCMGQVRVNRSKPKTKPDPTRKKRCEWIQNASFYNKFVGKIKTMSFWPKCVSFSFPCTRRTDSPVRELDRPVIESAQTGEENFEIPKLFVSPVNTPPINALLLTRSRSAPYSYRSSSLAFRFWEENNQREIESRSENAESEKITARSNIEVEEIEFVRRPELIRSKSEPARNGEKLVLASD
ncbi:hypothetical protein AALP_AA1G059800 [Arabis alpina]|uniref:Uncharacterized protein n=1 Tax=Arabis alpina TaxID=50452 RepID=A0A087HLE6_ARAAL|nr:hypothetical protein AALP_AA1G059800 [Arabis alpina]